VPSSRLVWITGVMALSLIALPTSAGPKWGPGGPPGSPEGPPGKAVTRDRGQVFCPSAALVYENILIPGGRCYVLSVLRNGGGTFLAFVPPDTKIPPGQLVRLNTPAGAKLKGRIFLVPIRPTVVLVPLDTMTLVATRIEDFGPRLAIMLVGTAFPHLTVVFDVRP
jgi:hypothetical protein